MREFDSELVMVVSKADPSTSIIYPHEQFIAALQTATLDRLAALIPPGASVRRAHRVLAAMRTPASYAVTMADALTLLQRHGVPVAPDRVTPEQKVVACFPGT